MGRYAARLQRLLGMPEDGGGIAFGSFRPADISAVVMELVPRRLQELDVLSRDQALSPQAQAFIANHKFHTYEDFCLEKKQRQPGKKDYIGYGASLERGDTDLPAYLKHIRERDGDFGEFLERAQPASISRAAFDTSVYVTGETNSGKSYLAETLAFLLAREANAGGVGLRPPRGAGASLRGVGAESYAPLFLFRRQSRGREAAGNYVLIDTFSVPAAFNRPGTYIFNLGKGVLGETASTMFGRLILAQMQAAAFKRERDGLTEGKVPTRKQISRRGGNRQSRLSCE